MVFLVSALFRISSEWFIFLAGKFLGTLFFWFFSYLFGKTGELDRNWGKKKLAWGCGNIKNNTQKGWFGLVL